MKIDKEAQDRAWVCATPETRKSVIREFAFQPRDKYKEGYCDALIDTFGKHNLEAPVERGEVLIVDRFRVRYMYREANEIYESTDESHWGGYAEAFKDLFGTKCLPDNVDSSDDSKADPKFKVGDMVRCLNDREVYIVMAKVGKYHYALQGVEHDVHESLLEPYPELTQSNDNMEEKEHRNLSQSSSNCDKCEEKELNLCEILKGHEGEEFYSLRFGLVKLEVIHSPEVDDTRYYLIVRPNSYRVGREIVPINGIESEGGVIILYPSRESYLKYPLDPKKAWVEWQEEQKPKRWRAKVGDEYWYIRDNGSIKTTEECFDLDDENTYEFGNYFRTEELAQQAAEVVKECLMKFHEQHNQQ